MATGVSSPIPTKIQILIPTPNSTLSPAHPVVPAVVPVDGRTDRLAERLRQGRRIVSFRRAGHGYP
jgi:hypothetical protein